MANCLFCVASLPSKVYIFEGEVKRVRISDGLANSAAGFAQPLLKFRSDGDDACIHDHLTTFFVLKRILKINDEILCKLLGLCDGDSFPECWVNVCWRCGDLVRELYQKFKENLNSEEVERIRKELIAKIEAGQDAKEGGPIWKRLRSEALKVDDEGARSPKPTTPLVADLQFVCHLCGFQTTTLDELQSHFQSHKEVSGETPEHLLLKPQYEYSNPSYVKVIFGHLTLYECCKCPARKRSLEEILSHVKQHVELDRCPDCGIYFKKLKMARHVAQKHKERLSYTTTSSSKAAGIETKYSCRHCPASFTQFSSIARHVKLHVNGAKAVVCQEPNCGWFLLSSSSALRYHQAAYHPDVQEQCDKCNFPITNKAQFRSHQKLHGTGKS